jgi:hypothetical protein
MRKYLKGAIVAYGLPKAYMVMSEQAIEEKEKCARSRSILKE